MEPLKFEAMPKEIEFFSVPSRFNKKKVLVQNEIVKSQQESCGKFCFLREFSNLAEYGMSVDVFAMFLSILEMSLFLNFLDNALYSYDIVKL